MSSHPEVSYKKGILKHFHKIYRKKPVLEPLFNKATGSLQLLLKRDSSTGVLL